MGKITIDRSVPFDPATFLGKGCSIEEQDERALVLTEVDPNNVRLEAMLKPPDEICVNGEERLKRLKTAGHIRLDAKIFQTLWENKRLIPKKWEEKIDDTTTYIFFDGTVLRDPHGRRVVLYLCYIDVRWYRGYNRLDDGLFADSPSAVLAS